MKIKDIWKKAFQIPFYVNKESLEQFADWNHAQWEANGDGSRGYCYINYIMINKELSLMLPKILYAKAIEEKKHYVPVILDWGDNQELTELYRSFGIKNINMHRKMVCNIGGILKSLGIMVYYRAAHKTGMELQKLKVDNVEIGRNIYGDILRSSNLSTIRYVDNLTCCKKIFTLTLFADTISKIVKKMPPKVCISDDWAYNEGIVLEYMNREKAYITQINLRRENTLTIDVGVFQRFRHGEMHTQIASYLSAHTDMDEKIVDAYLEKRFAGKNCSFRDKVAFQGKKSVSREEWNEQMGLDPTKKNIIIMCHTFSDAVFNSEYTAFRDYYDWTEQTLQIISKLDNVNWIVKPHPARANYNEAVDSIENMLNRYKSPNIHVFPDDVSTSSLKDVADALVTICGTGGMEFPCFGIPVVVCGKAMYTGFGFTNEPGTLAEYRSMLEHIDKLDKLQDAQISMARHALYAYIRCFDTALDEWDVMLYDKLHEMEDKDIAAEAVNHEMTEYNTGVLMEIPAFNEKYPWKQSEYYKRGERLSDRI